MLLILYSHNNLNINIFIQIALSFGTGGQSQVCNASDSLTSSGLCYTQCSIEGMWSNSCRLLRAQSLITYPKAVRFSSS
jgi:hypothetical protein